MDGLLALQNWDCVVETPTCKDAGGNSELRRNGIDGKSRTQVTNCVFDQVFVPAGSHLIQLYLLEDNAAVIQMIIKGRSPSMRHVTRTHAVTLERSFQRINSGPVVFVKYVRSNDPLADLLTKGAFSSQQW